MSCFFFPCLKSGLKHQPWRQSLNRARAVELTLRQGYQTASCSIPPTIWNDAWVWRVFTDYSLLQVVNGDNPNRFLIFVIRSALQFNLSWFLLVLLSYSRLDRQPHSPLGLKDLFPPLYFLYKVYSLNLAFLKNFYCIGIRQPVLPRSQKGALLGITPPPILL